MSNNDELDLSGLGESQFPPYSIADINKFLSVNDSATGLEWSNEAVAQGYISERGDGSTNTVDSYLGYIFKNKLNSGLFNYTQTPFDILALRINNFNILECTAGQINALQNIFVTNDSSLANPRLNFGGGNCGISGDSSTNGSHAIGFRTDNNLRMKINTPDGIVALTPIQIGSSLGYTLSNPHISKRGTFIMGISFDPTYGKIEFSAAALTSIAEFNYDRVDIKEPLIYRNPTCPLITIVENSTVTVPAILSGVPIYYLKRGMTTHSDLIFPNPASGFNCRYEIITDGNGNSSTFNCRLNTLSNDVLLLFNGGRTLITGPLVSYVLTLNAHYIFQFVEADNRWLLIRDA